MVQRLTEAPRDGNPRVYISIHHGIGGWNSSCWRWAGDDEDGFPGYEPLQTGYNNTSLGTGTREDAVAEATGWAEMEELPLWIPGE
jgi:hypothetical protein